MGSTALHTTGGPVVEVVAGNASKAPATQPVPSSPLLSAPENETNISPPLPTSQPIANANASEPSVIEDNLVTDKIPKKGHPGGLGLTWWYPALFVMVAAGAAGAYKLRNQEDDEDSDEAGNSGDEMSSTLL